MIIEQGAAEAVVKIRPAGPLWIAFFVLGGFMLGLAVESLASDRPLFALLWLVLGCCSLAVTYVLRVFGLDLTPEFAIVRDPRPRKVRWNDVQAVHLPVSARELMAWFIRVDGRMGQRPAAPRRCGEFQLHQVHHHDVQRLLERGLSQNGRGPKAGARLSEGVRGPMNGAPHASPAWSGRNTRALCVLLVLGLGFGTFTSAVDHGFGPASAYTSKIFGGMVAWLAAGLLAAWAGQTRRQAFERAVVFLLAAVVAYYGTDVAYGTYTNSIPGVEGLAAFNLQGLIVDVAFYTIISTVTALVLGAVIGVVRKGGVTGVLASIAVPAYISYSTLRTHQNPGPEPLLGETSGWTSWLALSVTAILLVIGICRLVAPKGDQREQDQGRSSPR